MRRRGRKRPPDAALLLSQVREVFAAKKNSPGARQAAAEIDVSLASFYNYAKGKTVPDLEVLRKANKVWGTKWKHIDLSAIMQRQNIRTPEQLSFAFLDMISEQNVEVVRVGREGSRSLRVALKIRFAS